MDFSYFWGVQLKSRDILLLENIGNTFPIYGAFLNQIFQEGCVSFVFVSLDLIVSNTLYALAKQSRKLGAYKLARYSYEKLQELHVPSRFQESIELGSLTIRSKPFHDSEVCLVFDVHTGIFNSLGSILKQLSLNI